MSDHLDLSSALATPDSDVATPIRMHSGSFTSQLATLGLGAHASKVKDVGHLTYAEYIQQGKELRDDLRNAAMSSIRAATRKTGYVYTTEVFNVISPSGRPFILAVVQRIE